MPEDVYRGGSIQKGKLHWKSSSMNLKNQLSSDRDLSKDQQAFDKMSGPLDKDDRARFDSVVSWMDGVSVVEKFGGRRVRELAGLMGPFADVLEKTLLAPHVLAFLDIVTTFVQIANKATADRANPNSSTHTALLLY